MTHDNGRKADATKAAAAAAAAIALPPAAKKTGEGARITWQKVLHGCNSPGVKASCTHILRFPELLSSSQRESDFPGCCSCQVDQLEIQLAVQGSMSAERTCASGGGVATIVGVMPAIFSTVRRTRSEAA